jgi:hypothetical protein
MFCVRLRSRTQKTKFAPGGRSQIERPLARKTPQPSVIVAGLESLARTAARAEPGLASARARIRKEGMVPPCNA